MTRPRELQHTAGRLGGRVDEDDKTPVGHGATDIALVVVEQGLALRPLALEQG